MSENNGKVKFSCPSCGSSGMVRADRIGQKLRCRCGAMVEVGARPGASRRIAPARDPAAARAAGAAASAGGAPPARGATPRTPSAPAAPGVAAKAPVVRPGSAPRAPVRPGGAAPAGETARSKLGREGLEAQAISRSQRQRRRLFGLAGNASRVGAVLLSTAGVLTLGSGLWLYGVTGEARDGAVRQQDNWRRMLGNDLSVGQRRELERHAASPTFKPDWLGSGEARLELTAEDLDRHVTFSLVQMGAGALALILGLLPALLVRRGTVYAALAGAALTVPGALAGLVLYVLWVHFSLVSTLVALAAAALAGGAGYFLWGTALALRTLTPSVPVPQTAAPATRKG